MSEDSLKLFENIYINCMNVYENKDNSKMYSQLNSLYILNLTITNINGKSLVITSKKEKKTCS